MANSKNFVMLIIVLVAGIAGYMASKQYFQKDDQTKLQSLLVFPAQKRFSGFELINKNQQKVTSESFANRWTLLFFGFTHCPDVCPTTLSELQKTYKLLETKKLKTMPEVLFVSVDPERDNADSLKTYIEYFNPTFNAATGDAANIMSIATQVGVAYHIQEHESGDINYSVDHTATIFLVNPEKKLYGIFKSPHEAKKIANDIAALLGHK